MGSGKRRKNSKPREVEPTPSSSKRVARFRWPKRQSARLRTPILPFEVFKIDWLLEKILNYAIHQNDGKLDLTTAKSLRLVASSWNETIVNLLRQSKEPVYKVPANYGYEENMELFFQTFTNSSVGSSGMIPFSLYISHDVCRQEHHEILSNIFTNWGSDLLEFGIWVYPFKGPFPKWSLPRLRKLDLTLVLNHPQKRGQNQQQIAGPSSGGPVVVGSSALINSILSEATGLTELNVTFFVPFGTPLLNSSSLDTVTLPNTVTKLSLTREVRSEDIEVFVKKPLPNLTSFTVTVKNTGFTPGLLSDFFNKHKATLKIVDLQSDINYYEGPPRWRTRISVPLMEKLEMFSSSSINTELEPTLNTLEMCLPGLKALHLCNQTTTMTPRWTRGCLFTLVTDLELQLADSNVGEKSDNFTLGFPLGKMRRFNLSFPNMTKLDVCISFTQTSVMMYIFKEIRQLTELKIKVFGPRPEGPDSWDSTFTGLPIEMISKARLRQNFSKEDMMKGCTPSITNLKELTSLSLQEKRRFPFFKDTRPHSRIDDHPIISYLTFDLSLRRMPKLMKLDFQGPFTVCAGSRRKWLARVEGRTLTYNP